MMERDQRRWKTADQNKDDNLDKEEYACFVHPESCEHMKDLVVSVSFPQVATMNTIGFCNCLPKIQETVEDIDKNKDGFVDADEYISELQTKITGLSPLITVVSKVDMYRPDETEKDKPEPDWVKSERQMFSDYRDKNKDGKLDKVS